MGPPSPERLASSPVFLLVLVKKLLLLLLSHTPCMKGLVWAMLPEGGAVGQKWRKEEASKIGGMVATT